MNVLPSSWKYSFRRCAQSNTDLLSGWSITIYWQDGRLLNSSLCHHLLGEKPLEAPYKELESQVADSPYINFRTKFERLMTSGARREGALNVPGWVISQTTELHIVR